MWEDRIATRVLADAPILIVVLDFDARVVFMNTFLERLTGWTLAEARGREWFATFLPERDHERIAAVFRGCALGQHVKAHVNPIVTRDGTEREIEWSDDYVRDEAGHPVGILAIGRDVTERLRAEAALAAERAQLEQAQARLLETQRLARLGAWELDLRRSHLSWSDEIYRIFEMDRERFAASYDAFLERVHPDDRAAVDEAYRRSVRDRSDYAIAHRLVTDGREKWVHERGRTEYAADGTPVRSVGTVQDITDVKLAERELGDRERRLAAVFDGTSDAMLLLEVGADDTFAVVAANRAHVTLVGRASDAIACEGEAFASYAARIGFLEAEVEALVASFRRVARERVPLALAGAYPARSDTVRVIETGVSPVFDECGDVRYLLVTGRDVTARAAAEQRLRASLAEQEILLREIHHRVKNNLQIISSLLHFQTKKARDAEQGRLFTELRHRLHAMAYVHDRLYQSRDVARIDLADYLRGLVIELVRSAEFRSGVTVAVAGETCIPLPIQSALPCGMIVSELVINVLKYAFPGGRAGHGRVEVAFRDGDVVVEVSDDGVGFPADFDPERPTSFGWELVRVLVGQLDGSVAAWTDAGAHVRLTFPADVSETP